MKTRLPSRRDLLAGMAGFGALSPLVPLFQAHAQPGRAPKRLVVFLTNPGMTVRYPEGWKPMGGETDFKFAPGSILEPLTPYRDKLVLVDGVDNVAGRDSSPKLEHGRGWGTILSGSKVPGGGEFPTNATIDQVAADVLGKSTPFRSLELGVEVASFEDTVSRAFYRAGGRPVPPENNPTRAFGRIFKGVTGATGTPAPDAELVRLRAQKKSVLDVVKQELTALDKRLGAEDRQKLDAHLTALRSVEGRLDTTTVAPQAGCKRPVISGDGDGQEQIPHTTKMQLEIIKSAFACDLTRVAAVQWGRTPSFWRYPWLNLSDESHKISHASSNDLKAQSELVKVARWHAEQMKLFLDMLSSVPEGGGTMLDNTIVMWTAEFSRSNTHDWKNMPYVLAGGAGGAIKTGRYLSYAGLPTNKLYTSICHALGVQVETVGDATYGTGTLPRLLSV